MALSSFPKKTKYTYQDDVYVFLDGVVTPVEIAGWRVEVDDPAGDSTGRQLVYYRFTNRGYYEVEESKVYASVNHLLSMIKGQRLNIVTVAGVPLKILYCKLDPNNTGSQATLHDFAGMDFTFVDFTDIMNDPDDTDPPVDFYFVDKIMDNVDLSNAVMPTAYDTLAEFKTNVGSYDKENTIWLDGVKIGER